MNRPNTSLQGKIRVHKYLKDENTPYEVTKWHDNTVTNTGKQTFLNIMAASGSGNSERLNSSARINLRSGTGGASEIKILDSTFDNTPIVYNVPLFENVLILKWEDDTIDVYTPSQARIEFNGGTSFAEVDINEGEKKNNETWVYEYALDISAAAMGDYVLNEDGLEYLLKFVSGIVTGSVNSLSMTIYSEGGATPASPDKENATVVGTLNSSSVSRDDLSITYRFSTSASGQADWWSYMDIFIMDQAEGTLLGLIEGPGLKPGNEIWHYDYTITIN